ncbi:MAG: heavy metal translocating P-type ATPase, partial [Planctomycetia bacterium]
MVDKTGTLTEGKPRIKSITNLTSFEESAFLKKITPVAQGSSHPLSKAIYQESIRRNIQIATATGIIEKPGEGLQGEVDGIKIILGKKDFVFSKVHSDPKIQYQEPDTASPRIFIGFNEKLAGWIEFEDRIRQSSPSAMSEIRKMGLDIILLTGDQANVAQKVATELKITNYHGNLSPLGKASFIKELISKGKTVAMAGDGTNDAPGLSTAQIGISMGTGTDLAKESAGLVILNSDLQSIQKAIYLSKFTMNAIRQNLILAFAYNLLCIPVAAFGFLNPLIAGIA